MAQESVSRRTVLLAGSGALLAAALPALAEAAAAPASILVVDPSSPIAMARSDTLRTAGQRLVMLDGDPMLIWRRQIAGQGRSVEGVTQWSAFVVLRELAHDNALRVRKEEHLPVAGGPLLVHWLFA